MLIIVVVGFRVADVAEAVDSVLLSTVPRDVVSTVHSIMGSVVLFAIELVQSVVLLACMDAGLL